MMFRRHLLLLCTSLAATFPAFAADVHVDVANTTGTENGSTLSPYTTITAAVAAAQANDQILVAVGTYPGPVRIEGVQLQVGGGYAGGTTQSYAAAQPGDFTTRDIVANVTIIQGSPADSVVLVINAGSSTINGFTIRGGGGANEDAFRSQGGGIFTDGGSPTISQNIIELNDARDAKLESFGGGVFGYNSDVTITGNIIRNNQAGRGAAIGISGGTVVISDNEIHDNLADGDHGGGIYAFSPDILIRGNRIYRNEVGRTLGYGWGGGVLIFNPGASGRIEDNVIYENFAPARGPGVFIDEGAVATMSHCILYGNISVPDAGVGAIYVDGGGKGVPSSLAIDHCTVYGHLDATATLGGNGLFVEPGSTATVQNSIFWGNDGASIYQGDAGSVVTTYTSTEETVAGTGNRTGDPLFADAAANDFHLRSTQGRWNPASSSWVFDAVNSPCIDAGNPASPYNLEPQGNGGRVNMGAYGNTPQASRTTNPAGQSGTGFLVK